MELTDAHERVLQVLAHGRSNTHHICQQAGLKQQTVENILGDLCSELLAVEIDRNLYESTTAGRKRLSGDYPAEAGFLQDIAVIHDAPDIKTIRLQGDRGLTEIQVDAESVHMLADAAAELRADIESER